MEQSQTQKLQSALTQAYAWVKSRRKQYPDADDVWSLRRDWMTTEPQLIQALAAGQKHPPAWVNLIYAAMKAGLYEAGHYYDTNLGIIKGSPLSYVLGSYYLSELDRAFMRKKSVKYVRYMDDIIILTKTRSALHRAIANCRGIVASLKLTLSHEKTYVGKTNKDFTFLGYCFKGASILEVAPQTIAKSLARVTSLLGQQTLTKERLDKHVQGFVRWAKGGLTGLIDPLKARDALLKALDEAGINQLLALLERQNINRKNRGILWLKESWPYRC